MSANAREASRPAQNAYGPPDWKISRLLVTSKTRPDSVSAEFHHLANHINTKYRSVHLPWSPVAIVCTIELK